MNTDKLNKIIKAFCLPGEITDIKPIVTGHINTTYRVTVEENGIKKPYTFQTINKYVFKNPELVMDNILKVTTHLKKKISEAGGDPERECLTVIMSHDNLPYYIDENGEYWRVYSFVDDSYTVDVVETPAQLESAGRGFGRFQQMLADFPMSELAETIPSFHDTELRLSQLEEAVAEDRCGRASSVADEIDFFRKRKEVMCSLVKMQKEGKLPLRVTHNDTKFNNILIDNKTNEALCVIDLDTVMPGLSVHEFGDAIRFAANSAEEDETNLEKVYLDKELYKAFTKGFISELAGFVTDEEIRLMPLGALVITLELASRFLADYINGDVYFKIHRDGQNLDRARCQMKLASSMEENMDFMKKITEEYL